MKRVHPCAFFISEFCIRKTLKAKTTAIRGEERVSIDDTFFPCDTGDARIFSKEETGLYYYGARYLDPKYSRWLSGDPALNDYIPKAPINDEAKKHNENLPGMGVVFNLVNLHLYHYAGNNPVKYTDPDERVFHVAFAALFGKVVGGISGEISSAIHGKNILAGVGGAAITGALIMAGLSPGISNMLGSGAGSVLENLISGNTDIKRIAVDAVGDAAIGGLVGKFGNRITNAVQSKIALLGVKAVTDTGNTTIVVAGNGLFETVKASLVDVGQDYFNLDKLTMPERTNTKSSDG